MRKIDISKLKLQTFSADCKEYINKSYVNKDKIACYMKICFHNNSMLLTMSQKQCTFIV